MSVVELVFSSQLPANPGSPTHRRLFNLSLSGYSILADQPLSAVFPMVSALWLAASPACPTGSCISLLLFEPHSSRKGGCGEDG
jgi:hypothetical protein